MASIAEINGLTIPASGGAFLLDQSYASGAAAAYSIRRLKSSTGALIRVRRVTGVGNTGNDEEADFSYDSNNELSLNSPISNADAGVNSTTLGSFLNVGTVSGVTYPDTDSLSNTAEGYCDSWYDQSGNSNDATQSTPGSQPQIHGGTVNTDLNTVNGKPNLVWTNDSLTFASSLVSNPMAVFHVKDVPSNQYFLRDSITSYVWAYLYSSQIRTRLGNMLNIDSGKTFSNVQSLLTFIKKGVVGVSSIHYKDGVNQYTAGYEGLDAQTGTLTSLGAYSGNAQEFVFYDIDKTSNRTDIENNMNSHFQIY